MSQPSQLPNAVPSAPGILFVLSTILAPSPLTPAAFADWYENTHIQEVQATGGISGSRRYESLPFTASHRGRDLKVAPGHRNLAFEFATVYRMPDLAFRESAAFRGLDGQTAPRGELLEGVFRHVSFVTRFAEEVGGGSSGQGEEEGGPAPFAVTLAPLRDGVAVPGVEGLRGVRRVRRYKVHEGSLLRRFERSWLDEPREMAILEVEDEGGLAAVGELVGEAEGLEVGFWVLRRDYRGDERTPKGWSPTA